MDEPHFVVWRYWCRLGYGRASDMLMHMSRILLAVALFHYVDVFFGLESCSTAESSFLGFADFNRLAGCRMKKEKATPPAPENKLHQITVDASTNTAVVSPTPVRRDKLRARALSQLAAGSLTPTDARCLAGKATFFDTSCMGRVGRAATKALYARQHDHHANASLTTALRASLETIVRLSETARPRTVPLSTEFAKVPQVCADA